MAEFRAFYHATLMVLDVCCRLLNGALLRVSAMWSSSIWTCLSTTMLRLFFVLRGKSLRLVPRLYLFLGFVIFFWTGEDGELPSKVSRRIRSKFF